MAAAGGTFGCLNASLRMLSMQLPPFLAMGLVYVASLATMLPVGLRRGGDFIWRARPRTQLLRGALHWGGLCMWFYAVPHITLAQTTAIGFAAPVFVMVGARWLLNERWQWDRWLGTLGGLLGVAVIVWPAWQGGGAGYALLMLGSAAMFAASFLVGKQLTRTESPAAIVFWQSMTVSALCLPLVVVHWTPPTPYQSALVIAAAGLMVVGNYCLTRAFSAADISASQPAKFLDLVWACLLGWLVFGEAVSRNMIAGAVIILASVFLAALLARERGV